MVIPTLRFRDTPPAVAWLGQFALADRALAAKLLDEVVVVSAGEFFQQLRDLIIQKAKSVNGPIALFAERELRHRFGVPHRLFKQTTRKPLRAEGKVGPPAIQPTKAYDPSVGSEGIVANLISQLTREFPSKFLNHPGPEQFRQRGVRAFWVVTDLLGSGDRAWRYLEAAWRVRSVRSWKSLKLLEFGVLAYAATEAGQKRVERHPSRPEVHRLLVCPTVKGTFPSDVASKLIALCDAYNPIRFDRKAPWSGNSEGMGWGRQGVLLAFAHGAPNNMPLLFHRTSKRKQGWIPLFPARVTAGVDSNSYGVGLSCDRIQQKLERLGQPGLGRSVMALAPSTATLEMLLVMGALSRPSRSNESIVAQKAGLPIARVRSICADLFAYGWIDSTRCLTDQGASQLRHARRAQINILEKITQKAPEVTQKPYYPSSLRHPRHNI